MSVLSPDTGGAGAIFDEPMVVAAVFPSRNSIWLLPYITSGTNKTANPDKKPTEYELSEIEAAIGKNEISINQLVLEPFKDVPEEYLVDQYGKKTDDLRL
jgi:hypothetical protein